MTTDRPKCKTCYHWDADTLTCHKAPRVLVGLYEGDVTNPIFSFPDAQSFDWCSEHAQARKATK